MGRVNVPYAAPIYGVFAVYAVIRLCLLWRHSPGRRERRSFKRVIAEAEATTKQMEEIGRAAAARLDAEARRKTVLIARPYATGDTPTLERFVGPTKEKLMSADHPLVAPNPNADATGASDPASKRLAQAMAPPVYEAEVTPSTSGGWTVAIVLASTEDDARKVVESHTVAGDANLARTVAKERLAAVVALRDAAPFRITEEDLDATD